MTALRLKKYHQHVNHKAVFTKHENVRAIATTLVLISDSENECASRHQMKPHMTAVMETQYCAFLCVYDMNPAVVWALSWICELRFGLRRAEAGLGC